MRPGVKSLLLVPALLFPQLLDNPLQARTYPKRVNIITTDYDLVDTTYIDRGRMDGVRVGDKFQVSFRDGKRVANVVVTGVYDRMSSVKIQDSELLRDGQVGKFNQRDMTASLEKNMKRPAPEINIKTGADGKKAPGNTAPASPLPPTPDASGLPPVPDSGGLPPDAGGLPDASGLPPAPDAGGLPTAPDMGGLPPAPDADGLPALPSDPAGAPPPPNF